MKNKLKLSTIAIEFISVSFAVFLALMVNNWKDNRNHKLLAKQSISNIKSEISSNKESMESMLEHHKLVMHLLDSLSNKPNGITKNDTVNVDLNFELISNNAWNAANLTQAILYIESDIIMDVSGIYQFQGYYSKIVENYAINSITSAPNDTFEEKLKLYSSSKHFLKNLMKVEESLLAYYNYLLDETLTNTDPEQMDSINLSSR